MSKAEEKELLGKLKQLQLDLEIVGDLERLCRHIEILEADRLKNLCFGLAVQITELRKNPSRVDAVRPIERAMLDPDFFNRQWSAVISHNEKLWNEHVSLSRAIEKNRRKKKETS